MEERARARAQRLYESRKFGAPPLALLERYEGDQVVDGLFNSDDPLTSVLNGILEVLQPDGWWVDTDDGFWWLPYRLRHEFRIEASDHPDGGTGFSLRIDVVIAENVTDERAALITANNLNRSALGLAVRFDDETHQLIAGARCTLNPVSWWSLLGLFTSYLGAIGTLERIALRMPRLTGGSAPLVEHPDLGQREEPDHFFYEHLLTTTHAQTGAGWGLPDTFSVNFAKTRQELLAQVNQGEIADMIDPTAKSPALTGTKNFGVAHDLYWSGRWTTTSTGFAHHPELGWGVETRNTLLAHFDGAADAGPAGEPNEWAVRVANLMNVLDAESSAQLLQVGGWSAWGNQLHRTSFLSAQTLSIISTRSNSFQMLLSMVCNDLMYLGDSLDMLDHLPDTAPQLESTNEVRWLGVEDIPINHYRSLLYDDQEIYASILTDGDREDWCPTNRYAGGIWALPVTELLASYGSISGDEPSVGTVSLSVDPVSENSVIITRRWTPSDTFAQVSEILPPGSSRADIAKAVRSTVGAIDSSEIEWFEFQASTDAYYDAVGAGFEDVAANSDADLMEIGRTISATTDNPAKRLDLTEPMKFLTPPVGDPAEVWLRAVTPPELIDNTIRVALRLWKSSPGPDAAEEV